VVRRAARAAVSSLRWDDCFRCLCAGLSLFSIVVAIPANGIELFRQRGEPEAISFDIFVLEDISISNIADEPKNGHVRIESPAGVGLKHSARHCAWKVPGFTTGASSDMSGQGVEWSLRNLKWRWRSHGWDYNRIDLNDLSPRAAKVSDVESNKIVSEVHLANLFLSGLCRNACVDVVASNEWIKVWDFNRQNRQFGYFGALLSRFCSAFSDSNRGFHIAGLFGGGIHQTNGRLIESPRIENEEPGEDSEQPISWLVKKLLVPGAFLLSFFGVLIGSDRSPEFAPRNMVPRLNHGLPVTRRRAEIARALNSGSNILITASTETASAASRSAWRLFSRMRPPMSA
jgi:hypothetical protein